MNYTLDSLKHVKKCLKERFKNHEIVSTPLIENLSKMFNNTNKNNFYFGVVTVGESANSETDLINFYDYDDIKIISVLPNNQIVLMFQKITSVNADLSGQFRGFEITVKDL